MLTMVIWDNRKGTKCIINICFEPSEWLGDPAIAAFVGVAIDAGIFI